MNDINVKNSFIKLYNFDFSTGKMDSTNTISSYSSDFSDPTETNSSDASSVNAINSDGSSYHDGNAETNSDEDISSLKPYHFEPSTKLVNNSSEESCKEDKAKNDE